jgi:hypothetical protein
MDISASIQWCITHWVELLNIMSYICLASSAIVKITPTLKDDNIVLPIIKFIGKYLALNKNVSDTDRPI